MKEGLRQDIEFYNKQIAEKSANIANSGDSIESERMRRERDARIIDLENIFAYEREEALTAALDPFR